MTKKKVKKGLSVKQTKFVKEYVLNNGNALRAAEKAYDVSSYGMAGVIGARNLKNPTIKEQIDAELARQGITLEKIIRPVAKGLVATKKEADGEVVDNIELQLKAHDRAIKLIGITEKDNETTNNFNFNIWGQTVGSQFVKEDSATEAEIPKTALPEPEDLPLAPEPMKVLEEKDV